MHFYLMTSASTLILMASLALAHAGVKQFRMTALAAIVTPPKVMAASTQHYAP
jgi:hypothetical protein